jgi:hypothetical protein
MDEEVSRSTPVAVTASLFTSPELGSITQIPRLPHTSLPASYASYFMLLTLPHMWISMQHQSP